MINLIDKFYTNEMLQQVFNQINLAEFFKSQQPTNKDLDRFQCYPTYETNKLDTNNIIQKYMEEKLSKIINKKFSLYSFFRKTLKSEVEKSLSYKYLAKHTDGIDIKYAGVIYLNSSSIKEGTYLYDEMTDLEPTLIVGSKHNRLVMYDAHIPHSPSVEQWKEIRLTQPFFIKEL